MTEPNLLIVKKDPSSRRVFPRFNLKNGLAVMVLIASLVILFYAALTQNKYAIDWKATYFPAARAFISLRSPYVDAPLFFAPVWSLIPLAPFALFPSEVGGALFMVASLVGFALLGYRAGCRPAGILALILSAPVANCLQTGNIEWIALSGIFMPAPVGLVFLSMKPQTTIGVILFILISSLRKGLKETLKAIAPVGALLLLSVWLYGPWFTRAGGAFDAAGSFVIKAWPYGAPIGLGLLYLASRKGRIDLALAASPWLSPYTILITWSGFVLIFARSTKFLVLISVLSWVIWFVFRLIRAV